MRAGELGRRDDPLDRHCGIGKRNVVADRSIEQNILLQHDADLAAEPCGVDHREIDAVDEDATAFRHIETLNKLGQGTLAGT